MTKITMNQKNFDDFTEALNHRMTRIESDVKWMKRILGWQVALISGIFATLLSIVIKSIFFV